MKLYTWTLTLLLVVANGHAKENLFALEIMQAVKNPMDKSTF